MNYTITGLKQKMVNVTVTMQELFKAISQLKSVQFLDDQEVSVGELNLMVNTPFGKSPVKSLIKKTAPTSIVKFTDGRFIHCADKHRFIDSNGKEAYADCLKTGDILSAIPLAVVESVTPDKIKAVYDLEVDDQFHQYYTANGILHHNTSICAALSMVLFTHGLQTLIIVPSSDLVTQTIIEFQEKLEFYSEVVSIGEYSGSKKDIDHPIVVATWQSLQNHPEYLKYFSAVIVDESHGVKAKIMQELINIHGCHISHRYGCTGTFPKPEVDQMALKLSIGKIVSEVGARWLIDNGYLSKIEIQPIETHDEDPDVPDYASEKAYLTNIEQRDQILAQYVMDLRDKHGNTMVLVNTQSLAQGRAIAELIPGAVYLDGGSKKKLRQEEYAKYAEQDNMIVIASAGIASTGLSIDRIFCLVMLDTGKSFVKCIQSVGRGLRKKGDKSMIWVYDIYSRLKFAKKHAKDRIKFYKEAQYETNATKKLKY